MQILGWFKAESGLCLTLEPSQGLRITGNLVRQELQGHEAKQAQVFGLVNDTHTATAEFFDDAVVRDDLADHWAEILG